MRLLSSCVFKTGSTAPGKEGPILLSNAKELSSIGYFQRGTVSEMFTFFSRTFAANKTLTVGARSSVKQQGFLCHLYVSPHGLTGVCFADEEYPTRVAFGYLSKLCEDFAAQGPLPTSTADNCATGFQTAHTKLLAQFQDPSQADQLTRIMHELEQTKLVRRPAPISMPRPAGEPRCRAARVIAPDDPTFLIWQVLHETIEAALERGQKIDALIEKSNDLSGSSKMFFKTAKKQNQCCSFM